ncbi:MAG: AAA family ATPase, partial [Bacteroidales bacterium]|nr:AAA family ATPase [Bacteroidales bacterium]
MNKKFDSEDGFLCVSRPRRFGKSVVGNLISAFYSRGADSRQIFEKLKIAQTPDWDRRLNKSNVIKIDMLDFWNTASDKHDVLPELTSAVVGEMRDDYPDVVREEDDTVAKAMKRIYAETGVPFVVIIDEYDVLIREAAAQPVLADYLLFLGSLFKAGAAAEAISLAYLTGIIPIVRDRVQSKLNNFKEYTMVNPRELAPYIGFTPDEVKSLCETYGMDFDECLRWYDGYHIAPDVSVCNSNSVCRAMTKRKFADYWTQTGAYTAVSDYVTLNFEGLRDDVT